MLISFKELAIGEIYTQVDFDDPEWRIRMVKVSENACKDCEYGITYFCDGDEIVNVGSLEDKIATLASLAFDAHQQAAELGIDEETIRHIFDAYNLLIAAGLDSQGNKRAFPLQ